MDQVFPTNVCDFKTIASEGYTFVDKTLMIRDIVSFRDGAFLFTRPRRFGKTMNLSMLHYFFDMDHPENRSLFEGLKVSRYPDVMSHFGKYKVIHMDFSMLESSDVDDFMIRLRNMVSMVYGNFKEISTSEKIDADDRRSFKELRAKKADNGQLMFSILSLSQWIEQVYGTKAVILIDEYDKPVIQAYELGFYQEFMVKFSSFMESSLKTNQAYKFAVMTGVSHISKASIFSGLNNLNEFDVFKKEYDEAFGFTESEVADLVSRADLPSVDMGTIKSYYDGYRFGDEDIYNPFSVMKYMHDCTRGDYKLKPYWVQSGDTKLITGLLSRTDPDFREKILALGVVGIIMKSDIDPHLSFESLSSDDPDDLKTAAITLMVTSGYLKAADESSGIYSISLPNLEVAEAFDIMMKKLKIVDKVTASNLIECICSMKADAATAELNKILDGMSPRDHFDENVHKTFMSALLGYSGYRYQAELGSGDGFADIYVKAKDGRPGLLMELKYFDKECDLGKLAKKALNQIRDTGYSRNIDDCHIEVGIAYRKHTAKVVIGNKIPPKG